MPEPRNGLTPTPDDQLRPSSRLNLPLRNDDEEVSVSSRPQHIWQRGLTFIVFNLVLVAAVTLILLAQFLPFSTLPGAGQPSVEVGKPATQTYYAPHSVTYPSTVLTGKAKEDARKDPANLAYDTNITLINQQRNALQTALFTIATVRAADGVTAAQQAQSLQSSLNFTLTLPVAESMVDLTYNQWQAVVSDTLRTYDQIMNNRELISDADVNRALQDVYANAPSGFTAEQRLVELTLLRAFVKPNRLLNEERTAANQQAAEDAVPPHIVAVQAGEVVLIRGQIVSAADVEKLQHLGISADWQDFVSAAGLVAVLLLLASTYLYLTQPDLWYRRRPLLLLGLSLILPTIVSRVTTNHLLLPYALPFAGVSIVLAVLLNPNLAMVYTFVLSLLVGLLVNNNLALTVFYFATGLSGIYATWRAERSSDFVRAGLYVSLISYLMLLLLRLPDHNIDNAALLQMAVASLVNGGLAAVFSFATFNLLGNLFGTTTPLQLLELAHPTQPLLRRLMHDAPGTYHHSLVVSNLAERAAEVVGADPLLARVGAYYHDIGKVMHPPFFVDNQAGMENIHDNLDPRASARIIAGHVRDGLELAKKHHLPKRVRDIIPQHHGSTVIRYFYEKAVAEEGAANVDINEFRYPGPRPQTKEAAIIMLADSVEAASRAASQAGRLNAPVDPSSVARQNTNGFDEDAVGRLVHKVISDKLEDGQLDECDLTIHDLSNIEKAFRAMLRGIYHPRVSYPEKTVPAAANDPTAETPAEVDVTAILDELPFAPNGNGVAVLGEPRFVPTDHQPDTRPAEVADARDGGLYRPCGDRPRLAAHRREGTSRG